MSGASPVLIKSKPRAWQFGTEPVGARDYEDQWQAVIADHHPASTPTPALANLMIEILCHVFLQEPQYLTQ